LVNAHFHRKINGTAELKIKRIKNKSIANTSKMYECLFLYRNTPCSDTRQSQEKLLLVHYEQAQFNKLIFIITVFTYNNTI